MLPLSSLEAPRSTKPAAARAEFKAEWQVTERNNTWHRVSYAVEVWSNGGAQTVNVKVDVENSNGLLLDRKEHRNVQLPASGEHIRISDFRLVSCPACMQVSGVKVGIDFR